ncbi:MAG: DUF2490 domain-containing protein [Pyrinomonadaceae bacterium]
MFLIIGFAAFAISAQITAIADDDDIQNWNDVNLTVVVNKKIDLYFPLTLRFDKNISRVNQERAGAGIVFKPTKSIAVTPFYSYIRSRNSAGRFRIENRFHLRFVYRFQFKKFGLSHRSQYEYRFRPTGNLWRYRPSITLEKELPKDIASGLKVFITEEPFYESASRRFSRNRLSFGINKALTKKLSLDIYYLRQDDNFSHPGLVHVIGTAWKIKL